MNTIFPHKFWRPCWIACFKLLIWTPVCVVPFTFVYWCDPKLYWRLIGRTNCLYYSTRVDLYSHQVLLCWSPPYFWCPIVIHSIIITSICPMTCRAWHQRLISVGVGSISNWHRVRLVDSHDDVIEWKHFPRYWPFVRGIPGEFPHKGQWRGALIFNFICAWTKGWVNNRDAGDLRRNRAHYDVTVIVWHKSSYLSLSVSDMYHKASRRTTALPLPHRRL